MEVNKVEYKLARKDVFVNSANLSAAFERMASEPKSKQKNIKDVHKFVVLNHILSSYIATIAAGLASKGINKTSADNLKLIKKSIAVLNECNKKMGGKIASLNIGKELTSNTNTEKIHTTDDLLLLEQLGFINKISVDISKVTDSILEVMS